MPQTHEASEFLEALYGGAESGYLSLWRGDTKRSRHFPLPGDFTDLAAKALSVAETTDVYVGVGLRARDVGESERGRASEVVAIPGLWLDLDVRGPGHKGKDLPANVDDALDLLDELEYSPSIIVHSGGGLHCYWVFKEPWVFDDSQEREEAASLVAAWQGHIRERAKARGWNLDNTSDLARVLRLPGTLNHKRNPPLPVRILHENGVRFDPSDFKPYRGHTETGTTRTAPPVPPTIIEGGRNATLTSLAGSMRRRGASADAILAALLQENAEKCDPPLSEREVKQIVTSISKYEPAKISATETVRDAAHAGALAGLFRDRFRWVWRWGKWLGWDGTRWVEVSEDRVCLMASEELRAEYGRRLAVSKGKEDLEHWTRLATETCIYARMGGALAFLRGTDGFLTEVAELDADPWVLNVLNGTIDLRTCTLRPHAPGDLLTKRAEATYEPGAVGEAWEAHLKRFLPNENVRRQAQRDLGTALVGAQLEESLPIWYGIGRNGKTTTAKALMKVLGDYAQRAAPSLLLERKHEEHPTRIADLFGARWVVSVEPGADAHLAESFVKELTGGEPLKGRYMHHDYFEFEPTHSLVLISNHKPTVKGTDDAIWRRVRLVPWDVQIKPLEERNQSEVVEDLVGEGPAILNWILAGLVDRMADRQWIAPEVAAATHAYREEQDALGPFLSGCCEVGPRFSVGVGEIYEAYEEWSKENAEEPIGKRAFGTLLRNRGLTQGRTVDRKQRRWLGIRLSESGPGTKPDNVSGSSHASDFLKGNTEGLSGYVRGNAEQGSSRSDDKGGTIDATFANPLGEHGEPNDPTPSERRVLERYERGEIG